MRIPHALLVLAVTVVPARAQHPVRPATRDSVLDAVVRRVAAEYVDPARGAALARAIADRRARGEYDALSDGQALADSVTAHLRQVHRDVHLRLLYTGAPAAPGAPAVRLPGAAVGARRPGTPSPAQRVNYGYTRVEVLPGNVGVVEVRGFSSLDSAGAAALAAVMTIVRHTDALVIDVRENTGGDRASALRFMSYFFPAGTKLSTLYDRAGAVVEEVVTLAVEGPRYPPARPVYVLTSDRTVSAGEAVAYTLQQHGRARTVGAATAGGAHGGRGPARVAGDFALNVPLYRIVDAASGGDWEGTGVRPDIPAPPADARDAALADARRRLAPPPR